MGVKPPVKPQWARIVVQGRNIERQGAAVRKVGSEMRCQAFAGENQCTQDRFPLHEHAFRAEDLP